MKSLYRNMIISDRRILATGGKRVTIRQRHERIIKAIQDHVAVSVADLSKELGVSEVTIRRDLDMLAEKGQIRRIHGGAVFERPNLIRGFGDRRQESADAKSRIGRAAAQLVGPNEVIFLDSGTTTFSVAQELNNRGSLPESVAITVATNGLNIALVLADQPGFDVFVIGGGVRPYSYSCVGPFAEELFRQLYADKCFLGVNGLSLENGLTTTVPMEARIKVEMARRSRQVIVVADSSKFGRTSFAPVGPLSMMHVLVTDGGIQEDLYKALTDMGIQVIIAT